MKLSRFITTVAFLTLTTTAFAQSQSDIKTAQKILQTSKTRRVNPNVLYFAKVVLIVTDHINSTQKVEDATKQGKSFAPSRLKLIATARYHVARLRSISPVPSAMGDADIKLTSYAMIMDEYLNGAKKFFYDGDETSFQITKEATWNVGRSSLRSAFFLMKDVLTPAPQPSQPKYLRKKIYE